MGSWKFEVAKFALYVFFPVGSFYAFHQIQYFDEEKLVDFQRRINTPRMQENAEMFKHKIAELRKDSKQD